jgi:hypothetical protein
MVFAKTSVLAIPDHAWVPACDLDGRPRKGAWVAEIERHEALTNRVEVGDLRLCAVVAAW